MGPGVCQVKVAPAPGAADWGGDEDLHDKCRFRTKLHLSKL